jgi:hypothetical protein
MYYADQKEKKKNCLRCIWDTIIKSCWGIGLGLEQNGEANTATVMASRGLEEIHRPEGLVKSKW